MDELIDGGMLNIFLMFQGGADTQPQYPPESEIIITRF